MIEVDIRVLTREIRLLREAIESLSGLSAFRPSPQQPEPRDPSAGDRPASPLPDSINEHDAAAMICLSLSTLRRWRFMRQGPPSRKLGRAVRYSRAQIQQWLDSQPGLRLENVRPVQPSRVRQPRRR